jgi:transcriptional regulator with XRE-family HTH domain
MTKTGLNTIGARIREARKLAGLSQNQLEMEAGNRRVSAEELGHLAEFLDVSVGWIVGEAPSELDADDPHVQLAARALRKLKPSDVKRLLQLFAAFKD